MLRLNFSAIVVGTLFGSRLLGSRLEQTPSGAWLSPDAAIEKIFDAYKTKVKQRKGEEFNVEVPNIILIKNETEKVQQAGKWLGLDPSMDAEEALEYVNEEYRKAARSLHPDKNDGNEHSEALFKLAQTSAEILRNNIDKWVKTNKRKQTDPGRSTLKHPFVGLWDFDQFIEMQHGSKTELQQRIVNILQKKDISPSDYQVQVEIQKIQDDGRLKTKSSRFVVTCYGGRENAVLTKILSALGTKEAKASGFVDSVKVEAWSTCDWAPYSYMHILHCVRRQKKPNEACPSALCVGVQKSSSVLS